MYKCVQINVNISNCISCQLQTMSLYAEDEMTLRNHVHPGCHVPWIAIRGS